jgi:hypothetical protein
VAPGPNYIVKNVWTDEAGNYQRALIVVPMSGIIPDFIEKNFQAFWILSRTSSISKAEIDETLAFVTAAGYDPIASNWQPTDQTICRQ